MTNELKEELEHFHRPENSAESLPTMNINSSSNGLSWMAPVPHFFVCFLLLLLFLLFFLFSFSLKKKYIYCFLSEEVFLTAVCAFESQTKFVKS